MEKRLVFVGTLGLYLFALVGSVEAQQISNSFSASVGFWKPSLEEANDFLELWAEELEDRDINATGDDEFSGNFIFGATLAIGLNERVALRGEISYWKNTVKQTAREQESGVDYIAVYNGEASASIRIIPVMFSGIYYLGDVQENVRPYIGGGLGLALSSVDVEASERVQVTQYYNGQQYNYSDGNDFGADDSGSNVILQFLGGIEFVSSQKMTFFAEAKYLSGNFNVEEKRNDVDEDISLSGVHISGGIRFYFGN